MQIHKEPFVTRYHEMGLDHLLRVQCLCNYMEEAAGAHAEILGAGIERLFLDNLAWVLAKMRIVIHKLPGPLEQVMVETWPVRVERLQFRRDFIVRGPGDEVLATAVTQWVVMGLESRKLERFPLYIAATEPENPPLAQESGDIRVPAVPPVSDGAQEGPAFPVRLADIDQNGHVNNGRYVDFALEAADVAGAGGVLRQIDLLFRAEGLRGDVIAVRSAAEAGQTGAFLHSLYRREGGQELARARTIFG